MQDKSGREGRRYTRRFTLWTQNHPYLRTFARLLGFLRPYRWSLVVSIVLAARRRRPRSRSSASRQSVIDHAIRPHDEQRALGSWSPSSPSSGSSRPAHGRPPPHLRPAGARRRVRHAQRALRAPPAPLVRLLRPPPDRPAHVARDGRPPDRPLLPRLRAHLLLPARAHDRRRHGGHVRRDWQLALVALAITPLLVVLAYRYSHVVAPGAARRAAEDGRRGDGRRGEHRRRPRRQVVRAGGARAGEVRAALERGVRPERAREPAARVLRAAALVPAAARAGRGAARRRADGRRTATLDRRRVLLVQPLRARCSSCRCACSACGSARRSARPRPASGSSRSSTSPRRSPTRRTPRAARRATGGRVRGRHVRLRPGAAGARRHRPRGRARPDDRADRPHRLGQDDAGLARAALLRRRPTGGCSIDGVDVRDVTLDVAAPRRSRVVSQDPFLFSATVRENIAFGAPGRDRRGGRARRAARAGARVHRRAARRLRHGDRRARDHALGRPAPADRDRARARHRPAHPDPRRRDRLGRRDDRGADPRSACARR